jgi:S1-C subfamily serine protease
VHREEWDDDDAVGRGFVPPHHRTWRHPSELSTADTVELATTAPVGRGLVVAASVIGVAMMGGLLALLLPRNGSPVNAGASVPLTPVAAVDFEPSAPSTTPAAAITTAPATATTATTGPATTAIPGTTAPAAPTTTGNDGSTPGPIQPPTTIQVGDAGAVGIGWGDGSFALTAASGLERDAVTRVLLPDGTTADAVVADVDSAAGLAVLSLPSTVTPPTAYAAPADGMTVSVPGEVPRTARLVAEGDALRIETEASPRPGQPLTDPSGAVVGLCRRSATGWYLVSVPVWDPTRGPGPSGAAPPTTAAGEPSGTAPTTVAGDPDAPGGPTAPTTPSAPSTAPTSVAPDDQAWLGVQVTFVPGLASVRTVREDSPAEAAGVRVGDVLVSLAGETIESRASLTELIAAHRPGETAELVVRRDGQQITLTVVFGVKPPEM